MSEAAYLKTLDLKASAHFPTFLYYADKDAEGNDIVTARKFASIEAVQEFEEENEDVELFDNPGLKLIPKAADIAGIVASSEALQEELDSVTGQLDMATKANAELSKMNSGLTKDVQSLKDQLQAANDRIKQLSAVPAVPTGDALTGDVPTGTKPKVQGSAPATSAVK